MNVAGRSVCTPTYYCSTTCQQKDLKQQKKDLPAAQRPQHHLDLLEEKLRYRQAFLLHTIKGVSSYSTTCQRQNRKEQKCKSPIFGNDEGKEEINKCSKCTKLEMAVEVAVAVVR